jgi:hypothetical protein
MEDSVAVIDRLIEEHKQIKQQIGGIVAVANDATALGGIDNAKEAFVPGRLDRAKGLQKLLEQATATSKGLHDHFNSEESGLLSIVEKYGSRDSVSALRSILLEHADLRNRFDLTLSKINDLLHGNLSRHIWDATANDLLAHITHTRKLIEAHAGVEQELFHNLREELSAKH